MGFVDRGETVAAAHSRADLKVIYRALHASLSRFPELMDTDFVLELQDYLHEQAVKEGVDPTHHSEWDAWLCANQEQDSVTEFP